MPRLASALSLVLLAAPSAQAAAAAFVRELEPALLADDECAHGGGAACGVEMLQTRSSKAPGASAEGFPDLVASTAASTARETHGGECSECGEPEETTTTTGQAAVDGDAVLLQQDPFGVPRGLADLIVATVMRAADAGQAALDQAIEQISRSDPAAPASIPDLVAAVAGAGAHAAAETLDGAGALSPPAMDPVAAAVANAVQAATEAVDPADVPDLVAAAARAAAEALMLQQRQANVASGSRAERSMDGATALKGGGGAAAPEEKMQEDNSTTGEQEEQQQQQA